MKTETQTAITDILSEDFIIPDCNADLSDLIDQAREHYNTIASFTKERRDYKRKVNDLIDELAERRNFRGFNYLR